MAGSIKDNRYGFFSKAAKPAPSNASKQQAATQDKLAQEKQQQLQTSLQHTNQMIQEVQNTLDQVELQQRYQGSLKILRDKQKRAIDRFIRKLKSRARLRKNIRRLLIAQRDEKPEPKSKVFHFKKPGHTNLFANDDYYTLDIFAEPSPSLRVLRELLDNSLSMAREAQVAWQQEQPEQAQAALAQAQHYYQASRHVLRHASPRAEANPTTSRENEPSQHYASFWRPVATVYATPVAVATPVTADNEHRPILVPSYTLTVS